MISPTTASNLKKTADEFKTQVMDNPQRNPLTTAERLWIDELSKVYLCVELDIPIPDDNTADFRDALTKLSDFGNHSALETRLYVFSESFLSNDDFYANTANYLSTLNRHYEHWSTKHIESTHAYLKPRPIEEFMSDYFDRPESVTQEELTYYLTFYFKHFYKFLHDLILIYVETHSQLYYGRASTYH
jgi:hypothetical protein